MEKQLQHTHIESKTGLLDLKLDELWRYRDLIILFTKRSFTVRYKQTILGPAWLILNPFITSVMYNIIFGVIAGLSTEGVPQLLFYMGSNAVWSFFAACLTTTANTFLSNAGIFGKVYFPRLTMPISAVLSAAINFFIQLLMFGFFWIYFIALGSISPHFMLIPLFMFVLLQLGCLGLGFGIIISSLTTKYRDLGVLVGFGVSLWMYGTPVVYPISQISNETLKLIIHINPVSQALETFRYIFLGTGEVSLFWWMITILITILVLFFGIILFNKVEKTFMDTI
ncbi:MAG: ABC transporter permease [Erysipelotrichaceae bacterium]|nr:ABC transporter permease [Erysipelotrichaceae bacterium]